MLLEVVVSKTLKTLNLCMWYLNNTHLVCWNTLENGDKIHTKNLSLKVTGFGKYHLDEETY
jgi:hypothetical protein